MKRTLMLLALIAVIAVMLSGCGGGGGGGSVAPDPGPVSISISPTSISLSPGDTRTFTTTVSGASNLAVTWYVEEGNAGGTIAAQSSSSALYTAPNAWNTFHVRVTSVADPTKYARATITIGPPPPPPDNS